MTSRERVRLAAVKLFAAKGFHGTGIRDLALEAKLSSASLYHYMGTKEDLLAAIMTESLQRLLDAAEQACAGVSDPAERLRTLVELHVLAHAVQPEETRVVDNEVSALSPEARAPVVELRDAYERLWAETIEDGVTNKMFTTAHPAVTRLALLEMCSGVARWYSPRGPLSLEQLAGHYSELAMRALGCAYASTGTGSDRSREVVFRVWGVPV